MGLGRRGLGFKLERTLEFAVRFSGEGFGFGSLRVCGVRLCGFRSLFGIREFARVSSSPGPSRHGLGIDVEFRGMLSEV